MMNKRNRELLATFVSQRMEMGENEWFLPPDVVCTGIDDVSAERTMSAVEAGKTPSASSEIQKHPSTLCGTVVDSALISAQHSLDDLNKAVCGCLRCPLGNLRKNFVFGDGNPDAGVMFIGEAPGADEDAQGVPFVGRAGQLLTRMIEAIKFKRSEVYIGNILKCRPPNNRDPKPEEIEMCEPILLRQIDIIRPKIICALGRISGQTLLRTKATLGALRGKVHDYHGVKFIVTYHPAALLRNPNWKKFAWEDLKMARREFDGLEL